MKTQQKVMWLGVIGLFLVGVGGSPAWGADPAGEEKELDAAAQEMDTAPAGSESARVNALAQQYDVEPAAVQQMRDKRQGWGEISTQLAMAEHLSKTDPAQYPSFDAALDTVQAERAKGSGYGRIAKDLGFKLGPVISDVKRSKAEFRPEKLEKMEKRLKQDRTERIRMEKPERPEKPMRPDEAGRPNR